MKQKKPKKHPGGRPTKYSIKMLEKTKEYIKGCEDKEYQVIRTEGNTSTTWENKIRVNLPTIEGLALFIGITKETMYQWEKEHKEFSDLIGELRQLQAQRLIDNGLSGNYNPTIAKVLLTKHGYREGIEQTGLDGKDLTLLTDDQISLLKEKIKKE